MPITSNKLHYTGSYEDLRVVVNYVYENYTKNQTRFYMYGCSMGGLLIGSYLANYSEEASEILDGVSLLSTPWDIKTGEEKFYTNSFGIYQWAMGMLLTKDTRENILPKMKPYLS